MTDTSDDPEQEHVVDLAVRLRVFGHQDNVLKIAARVKNDLQVTLHQPDLDVRIAGINREHPVEALPIEIPDHLT